MHRQIEKSKNVIETIYNRQNAYFSIDVHPFL